MTNELDSAEFRPLEMFRTLNEHGVEYVVIVGVAAIFHGTPTYTNDADICPRRTPENLRRLAAALSERRARIRTVSEPEGLPFACDAESFERVAMVNMLTDVGQFDVSFAPAATDGYDDLATRAIVFEIEGVRVPVASLDDVIRSKETANRAKDHAVLPVLYALADEIAAREQA